MNVQMLQRGEIYLQSQVISLADANALRQALDSLPPQMQAQRERITREPTIACEYVPGTATLYMLASTDRCMKVHIIMGVTDAESRRLYYDELLLSEEGFSMANVQATAVRVLNLTLRKPS